MTLREIKSQVKLPIGVAVQVVLQGIRIRFGRSLVTMSGVALGIAFLMSIFTGQIAKKGVGEEEAFRQELGRMLNFFTAEVGPVEDRSVSVVQAGPLNTVERRFVDTLRNAGVTSVRWVQIGGGTVPSEDVIERVDLSDIGAGASGLIVLGDAGRDAVTADWKALVSGMNQRIIAVSRTNTSLNVPEDVKVLNLSRDIRPDELAKRRAEEQKARFRNIWIVIISLLVTVIGISNAMLMSVTERFREIGTMKCLGSLSSFIRQIFLIESSLIGLVGSLIGALFGAIFSLTAYSLTYGPTLVLGSMDWPQTLGMLLLSLLVGVALSILAALYPASFASRMVPATALRSNI